MQTYHLFVVLLINADHRLLYYNVSDFREVRKIVPLFSDFVFLLVLLLFIFQFFPFQFIFFLFNRNNLTVYIKGTELSGLSHFLREEGHCFWETRAESTSREKRPACLDFRGNGRGHRGLRIAVLGPTREYWTFTSRGDLNEHNDLTPYIIYEVQVNPGRQITAH